MSPANILLSRAPPPNRAMARFSSLVAIAAVAVVTSDALVLNVDD